MTRSADAPELVREHFRDKAGAFDDLYEDERPLVRLLRPGLFRRRSLAADTVGQYAAPRVLDVGCGSGRIAEFALARGAGSYLGIDFSEPMLDLARSRLVGAATPVRLVCGDFTDAPLEGPFDVILALGLFDYLPQPALFTRRMFELCAAGGCVVGSFPRWSLIKGPVRKVRYEWINDCPIFNYSRRELELLFSASGFDRIQVLSPGSSGHLVRAYREFARSPHGAGAPEQPSHTGR